MQHHDDLPVNISFIMEGAEESASTDLDKYLEKHADKLRGADLLDLGTRDQECLGAVRNFWWK